MALALPLVPALSRKKRSKLNSIGRSLCIVLRPRLRGRRRLRQLRSRKGGFCKGRGDRSGLQRLRRQTAELRARRNVFELFVGVLELDAVLLLQKRGERLGIADLMVDQRHVCRVVVLDRQAPRVPHDAIADGDLYNPAVEKGGLCRNVPRPTHVPPII